MTFVKFGFSFILGLNLMSLAASAQALQDLPLGGTTPVVTPTAPRKPVKKRPAAPRVSTEDARVSILTKCYNQVPDMQQTTAGILCSSAKSEADIPFLTKCYNSAPEMTQTAAAHLCAHVESDADIAGAIQCYNNVPNMDQDAAGILCTYVTSAAETADAINCYNGVPNMTQLAAAYLCSEINHRSH